MRVMIGLAPLLAVCHAAMAQTTALPAAPTANPSPNAAPMAAAPSPSLSDEERARQAALDSRIALRNKRAMGSVCRGCRGAADRPARSRIDPRAGEVPIADPAQAPLD